jgi:hypothetical protein
MDEHTPTPWMTQPCGELLPDDVMIVADRGKVRNGIQSISTVARALSIRQTKEVTAANAAFIVQAVNSHDALVKLLNEVKGCWGAFEPGLRESISNTNYQVVLDKIADVDALLAVARPDGGGAA